MSSECSELRLARKRLGLTQKQLAVRLCCNRVTVANWELSKRKPHPVFMKEIVRLLEAARKKNIL